MSITLSCPHCSRAVQIPDTAAGKNARCPFCRAVFPTPVRAVPFQPIPVPVLPVEKTHCSYCREQVQPDARVCPHCREVLDNRLRERRKREQEELHEKPPYRFPHNGHILLSILTCGTWLPIYLIHWLLTRES